MCEIYSFSRIRKVLEKDRNFFKRFLNTRLYSLEYGDSASLLFNNFISNVSLSFFSQIHLLRLHFI